MIKCEIVHPLRPNGTCVVEVDGPCIQIITEVRLLIERCLKRKAISPAAARWAVESAIEICKLGDGAEDYEKYTATCKAAEEKAGLDWGEFIRECRGSDLDALNRSIEAKAETARKSKPTIEVHVIKL